ncbi:MAG: redoxin domain-containing protein, partial [Pseudomonadota bacterium]
ATALACSFRDSYDMVRQAGIEEVFGISAQSPEDHREAAHRLALPYTLLSDPEMRFSFALDLPRFILNHQRYTAPAVLIAQGGRILAALHPVRHAPTAAQRVLRELAKARLAHQKAQIA